MKDNDIIADVEEPNALISPMEAFSAYSVTKIKYLKLERTNSKKIKYLKLELRRYKLKF